MTEKYFFKDGKCEPDVVMKMFIDIIRTKALSRFSSTVGVLGPACSNTVEAIAGVSKHYRYPIIPTTSYFCWIFRNVNFRTAVVTYSAKGSTTGREEKYPYFFRTVASNRQDK